MAGSDVPYQLRPNKFVERQLFLDLLDFVRVWNGPSSYVYASMGGRFLEDFKAINERFAIQKMISIEDNVTAWGRQLFNKPFRFVECRHQNSKDFLNDFPVTMSKIGKSRFIVWLDYATANMRGTQLAEFQELVTKLRVGDVAKVTLNANFKTAVHRETEWAEATWSEKLCEAIKLQLGDYSPPGGILPAHLTRENFAKVLAGAVKQASLDGIAGSAPAGVVPLGIYRYADGEHQMLTVTVLITDERLERTRRSDRAYRSFKFRARTWDDIHLIQVPDMSPRERDYINAKIANRHRVPKVPFQLGKTASESVSMLENYLLHYRRYPAFGRIRQ